MARLAAAGRRAPVSYGRSPTRPVRGWTTAAGIAAGLATLLALFSRGVLRDRVDAVYEEEPPPEIVRRSVLRFEESSRALGLRHRHRFFFPHPFATYSDRQLTMTTVFPAVAVADVDGDGFQDVYVSAGQAGVPNKLFMNRAGRSFHEEAELYGIARLNERDASGQALFADFSGDGRLDLLVSKYGCHSFLLGTGAGRPFQDATPLLGGYCSNPKAVNFLDYDGDGRLDLVFGNYLPSVDLRREFPFHHVWGVRNDKSHGGENVVLRNTGRGFRLAEDARFPGRTFTNSVGVSDIDADGRPDLFFGNDYSTDEMFLNRKEGFRDVTESFIPIAYHGHAGMNAEFADFDQDGGIDLYVTNIYKPPYLKSVNLLWRRTPSGFEQASERLGTARCGFAWGAKFADFDLDGDLDLLVVNGKATSEKIASPEQGVSHWHERSVIGQTPLFLRSVFGGSRMGGEGLYISGFERSCLFEQEGGGFHDVAGPAGIDDRFDGKGLALLDIENDGLMDFVVVNSGGPTLVYRNRSRPAGDWIGLVLEDRKGARMPIGARVRLLRANGPPLVRELYPANGFRSQSDPRFVFGLGRGYGRLDAEVEWPGGTRERFPSLRPNAYRTLAQGRGEGR